MKKIILVIVGLIIILGGYMTYQSYINYENRIKTPETEYYKKLRNECESKNSKNCCLASVAAMEHDGGVLFPQKDVDGCKDDFEREMMNCIDSFTWCKSVVEKISISNIQENNMEKFNQIKLPDNIITEKDCTAQGGEVWNTLGETSYEGELIGKIEGLRCPCVCLVKLKGPDEIWVEVDGKMQLFADTIDDIKTFDDCVDAGFKIKEEEPEICTAGESYISGGRYKTFTNNPKEAGKKCTDYYYSTCPGSCVATCKSSSCSNQENGEMICTTDCDGVGSCVAR